MNEQINEMAKDICHLNVSCDECTMLAKQMGQSKERYCKAMQYAKRAYEKGYRKQHHGTWIDLGDQRCQCSECGSVRYGNSKACIIEYHLAPFCEKCGAFMQNDQ